jgi:hypothetical protein
VTRYKTKPPCVKLSVYRVEIILTVSEETCLKPKPLNLKYFHIKKWHVINGVETFVIKNSTLVLPGESVVIG